MVRPVIAKSSSSIVEEEAVEGLVRLNSKGDKSSGGTTRGSYPSGVKSERKTKKKSLSPSSQVIDMTMKGVPSTGKEVVKTGWKSSPSSSIAKLRGGVTDEQRKKDLANRPFPEKLMDLLQWCDSKGSKAVESLEKKSTPAIRWLEDGRSFEILSIQRFTLEVLPKFFEQTEYSSFTRKLYWWGFKKKSRNEDGGHDTFYHELFLRDDPKLCTNIRGRRSSGQQQTQQTVSNSKYQTLKRSGAASPHSSPTVSTNVSHRKRDSPTSTTDGPFLPPSKQMRIGQVERVTSSTPRHPDVEVGPSKSSLLVTPPNTPPFPVLASTCCEGGRVSSVAADNSLVALRQSVLNTRRRYGAHNSSSVTNARRVSNDFVEMLAPCGTEGSTTSFRPPSTTTIPSAELSTNLREAVLKRRHELLIEQQRHEKLQQEKVLAAAAIMEAHTRRARDLQRQQEEAERQAVAAAALILGSSNTHAGSTRISSYQPKSPGTLAIAQEELLLQKRLSLLASSKGESAVPMPRSVQHNHNLNFGQDTPASHASLFLR